MNAENRKRLMLYSAALLLMAGLAYGGFVYRADPDAATLVGSAEILAQSGLFDKAIVSARSALKQEPNNRYAHIILAHSLRQLGSYDESVSHYRRAVELSDATDTSTDALKLYLGEALIQANQTAEAVRLARGVLDKGENQGARYIVAAARIAENQFEVAESEYARCAEVAPDDPEPLVLHASLLERLERYEGALKLLEKAGALAPSDPAVHLPRARLLVRMGRDDAAVETLLLVAETHAVRMQDFLFEDDVLEPLRTNERLLAACPRPIAPR
jgi:tetratricopeptide (TPR) repeat protein